MYYDFLASLKTVAELKWDLPAESWTFYGRATRTSAVLIDWLILWLIDLIWLIDWLLFNAVSGVFLSFNGIHLLYCHRIAALRLLWFLRQQSGCDWPQSGTRTTKKKNGTTDMNKATSGAPIAIGHMSDSGEVDPKLHYIFTKDRF